MITYATTTNTRRNLAELRRWGWRLLLSPVGSFNAHGFGYALDNGAWSAYQQGTPWDAARFVRLLEVRGADADWVVAPDIVCGGAASLALSLEWLPRVLAVAPRALLAVQNGMDVDQVRPHLGPRVGVFVGGDTEWKLSTISAWAELCRQTGAWCHVGRVNTQKRISRCASAGVHSFDGTKATRFAIEAGPIARAASQSAFLFG